MTRGQGGTDSGYTIVELLFAIAITGTLTAIAVPQGLRALDDFETRSAAQFLAQRLAAARFQAIKRSASHGLRFEGVESDYRFSLVIDGNRNGLRSIEIQDGVDRTLSEPEMLSWHFSGVAFGIANGVPDADGNPTGSTDGVRIGVSRILSMNGDGTATSGTLYIRGGGRSQYAVRVLGTTGRIRLLRFDAVRQRWVELS